MTDETSEFVYIGADGIGTVKYTNLDNGNNTDAVKLSSYMAAGKLVSNSIVAKGGWIGSEDSGFEISGNAIRNVRDLDGTSSYMDTYQTLIYPNIAPSLGGESYDFTYVGTDGIGTINTEVLGDGVVECTARSYMANGELFSNSATITGNITATSGTIGGFNINGDSISSTDIEFDGNNISSKIQTGSVLLSSVAKNKPDVGGSTDGNGWRLIIGPGFGVTGTGKLYATGAKITGDITAENGFIGAVKITGTGLGVENKLGDSFITGTSIGSTSCWFEQGFLGGWTFKDNYLHDGYYYLNNGTIVYGNVPSSIYTQYYTRFYPDKLVTRESIADVATDQYVEWDSLTTITMNSDERLKNCIETFSDEYDTFFDMLRPKRYKYNDGTSNRYHTGYIAQEVVQSLEKSGLSTSDFAAVMLRHPGSINERWQLRRDEFVSLNTWQIQKLKARVAELEAKIATLV
jgi:hypothetical protein